MKRILSFFWRSASMMPLMPSPGMPKMTSTPQSNNDSTRTSDAFMAQISPAKCDCCARVKRCHAQKLKREFDGGVEAAVIIFCFLAALFIRKQVWKSGFIVRKHFYWAQQRGLFVFSYPGSLTRRSSADFAEALRRS